MKEKLTLQQQLNRRKYKIPNKLYFWIYKFVMVDLILRKHPCTVTRIDDIRQEKDGAIVLWNHLSRLDHAYVLKALYPKRFNMIAAYNEFFRSHLAKVFKMNNILPKKNFCMDPAGVKAILSIIKQKGVVTMAPEGLATIDGVNERILPGVGHLIKHCKVPVYFLRFEGQFLVAPTSSPYYRDKGHTDLTLFKMLSKEDIEKLSPEEIEEKIMEEFSHDDFDYQEKHHYAFDTKGKGCEGLSDVCYKCPACGEEFKMHSHDDEIECKACGFHAHMNEYLELVPDKEIPNMPKYQSKWALWERKCVIDEIRKDPDFSFSFKTKIGTLPTDHLVKGKDRTTEPVGEGIFTMDHQGMHFKGTKNGEEFSVDLSYEYFHRLNIEVSPKAFSLYINSEYHEFTPEEPVVGKAYYICHEMHRLHFNTWKCCPGYEYLYE